MTPTWTDYKTWLSNCLQSNLPEHLQSPAVTQWGTDSRSISGETWFVPIVGENFDGHDFINGAMEAGAAGFLYQAGREARFEAKYLHSSVKVTDTLEAYQHIAAGWRQTLEATVIAGITGSVGKTTTKEMISCVFRKAGSCFSTSGSFNNEIGVPKSLLQISDQNQFAILEFGAKRLGNIRFLCDMAKPDIAVLLNVGVAHLGIFGSIENLRNTKLEIFRNCPASATIVANHDDPQILAGARATGKKLLTFGYHQDATLALRAVTICPEKGTTNFEILFQKKLYPVVLNTCHSAFPVNAAAALATGIAAGIPIETTILGLQNFAPIPGRYQILNGLNLTAVDDTYNANPESMKAGLTSVFNQFPDKKITLLLGDMLELGEDGPSMHEKIGEFLRQFRFNRLVTVGKDAHLIQNGLAGKLPADCLSSYKNVTDAIEQCESVLKNTEVLFVKGSNGIGLSRFLQHLQRTGHLT